MTNFHATKLHNLHTRHQRLDNLLQAMQAEYDLETRVEERLRLAPRIAEKERERDAIEGQIRALEAEVPQADTPASAVQIPAASAAPCLFYSYAHEDEALRDELAKHLKLLERQGVLSSWHDRDIRPGTAWDAEISNHLLRADIILLLVSADFMASDYIWGKELEVALERLRRGEAQVIPIILRPVDWQGAPFGHLQALPRDARPVTSWPNQDEAFADIARALREAALKGASRLDRP